MTTGPDDPGRHGDGGPAAGAVGRRRVAAGFPRSVLAPAGIAVVFLLAPLVALVARAPWSAMPRLLADPLTRSALTLSLGTATAAAAICAAVGVPLAWVLARSDARAVRVVRSLVTIPLVLPPVVGGVALLMAFGRTGVFGGPLAEWTGASLPFTTAAVVVAETFVAMPFLVISVEGAFRAANLGLEEAAATLGAGRLAVLTRVTLPLVAPAIGSGLVLSWARALGEFGATITFAGNFPGRTQTVPLAVYLMLQTDPQAAVALSLILLAVSVVVLTVTGRRVTGTVAT